ncbi:prepilin-type N-terminal cleavage/methylation domain-containing protein [Oceanisphaera sp. KMM 10153]|uniref:prepilin-type N-terminal cleavage/methylation domain-containing protein n=1 Tax=Oceanisphaera submarina TaxID=3390193 RepID=UPI00397679E0
MKARGFTLLELVIVLVLIGISAIFGTRFIADMATTYVGTAERGQALAGARFAMERIKRELSLAYSPSVYVSANDDGINKRCVSFVPVLASGRYLGQVKDESASFIIPLVQQGNAIEGVNLAVRADSGEAVWQDYPQQPLPTNVAEFKNLAAPAPAILPFEDAFNSPLPSFEWEGMGERYVLLQRWQVRFCLDNQGELWREEKEGTTDWSDKTLMLTGLTSDALYTGYNGPLQLLGVNFRLATREGELVLPSQIQVIYEP